MFSEQTEIEIRVQKIWFINFIYSQYNLSFQTRYKTNIVLLIFKNRKRRWGSIVENKIKNPFKDYTDIEQIRKRVFCGKHSSKLMK